MGTRMRGLNQFIADIRNCPNKETENKRVEKEMAKIRQKFVGNRALEGYHKKKYIWKLLYMLILGYDVDFGHIEAATLITAGRFSEKCTGYIALSLMISEKDNEIFMRIAQSVRNDLVSSDEVNQSMAIAMIGTLAPKELVDVMAKDIEKMALSDSVRMPIFIRKKSCLCLLRIFRKYRELFNTDGWSRDIFGMLDQKNLGFISGVVSLLHGVAVLNPHPNFEESVPKLIAILQKLVLQRDCTPDYLYYKTPNPWVIVKILKALQLFPPPERNNSLSTISEILLKIVTKTEVTKNVNKNNTDHGILFEAINLIVHYRSALHSDLRNQAISLLGVFISVKEPNIRYLALEAVSKFSDTPHAESMIKEHLKTILKLLRDNDVSIRRRALDILYIMCSASTSNRIVQELLNYSDEPDLSIKEELVLKIAILAEKFADDLIWYIDVVVRLISNSGDYITEDIWYRIIQIITGFGREQNPELQKYAANKLFAALSIPNVHENVIKVGAYVLAEYGYLIANQPGREPYKIYEVLNKHWINCNTGGKSMLLNAYVKLANTFPDLKQEILFQLEINSEHWDPEIQQRAVEYVQLLKDDKVEQIKSYVLQKMPAYSEEIQNNNPLMRRIFALKTGGLKSNDPTLVNTVRRTAEDEMNKSRMNTSSMAISSVTKDPKGSPPSQKSSNYATTTTTQGNLLDDEDLLGGGSTSSAGNLKDHPLYSYCKDKLASGGNIVSVPNKLQLPSSNGQEFKALLSIPNGVIYQDNNVTVNYKSQYQGSSCTIAMQFVTKGAPLSNVIVGANNTSNLFFKTKPVQYGEHPSVLMECLNRGVGGEVPMLNLSFNQGGSNNSVSFGLPIQANKWLLAVNMPQQTFDKYYNDYTTSNNDNYARLDNFIRNPAPPHVPLTEVMKKVNSLFEGALNMMTYCLPDQNNIKMIDAVGQYVMQSEGSKDPSNLPVLIQVECFEQNKEYLRLSLRGAANGGALKNLYQLITLYMNV